MVSVYHGSMMVSVYVTVTVYGSQCVCITCIIKYKPSTKTTMIGTHYLSTLSARAMLLQFTVHTISQFFYRQEECNVEGCIIICLL